MTIVFLCLVTQQHSLSNAALYRSWKLSQPSEDWKGMGTSCR